MYPCPLSLPNLSTRLFAMFSYTLLRLLSLLTLSLHTVAAVDSNFFIAASDTFPISGLDGNLKAPNTKIPDLGSKDPLEIVFDLQLDEPLFLVDQNRRCSSGNSPEEVQPPSRIRGRWRRKREESSSCTNAQHFEQKGTTSPPTSTDQGKQPGTAEMTPESGQDTAKKDIPEFKAPTGAQLGAPNTGMCGAGDEMNIPVCHPQDASDPLGVFLFPCRASEWHYYSYCLSLISLLKDAASLVGHERCWRSFFADLFIPWPDGWQCYLVPHARIWKQHGAAKKPMLKPKTCSEILGILHK